MEINLGDTVELKKAHPCGSKQWLVTRVGMDIKLRCLVCGHEIISTRHKLEKNIKLIVKGENSDA